MNDNADIVKLITCAVKDRLAKGKREYKQEIDIHDGRNWTKESLEEALDLSVYLSAELLKKLEPKKYRYIVTARLSDGDNDTFVISMREYRKAELEDIKTKIFWLLTENCLGKSKEDSHDINNRENYRDIHMVSVCEVTSDFEYNFIKGSNCTLFKESYLYE